MSYQNYSPISHTDLETQRFHNVQALRALAALLVFFHHALDQYVAINGSWAWFKHVAHYGYAGVDIFFVISGFVAAHSTLDKPRTASHARVFLTRRFMRIYLGYWPFFALALALTYFTNPATLNQFDLVASFLLTTIELQKLLLYVTWSLSYELIFYVIVAYSFILTRQTLTRLIPAIGVFALVCQLLWLGEILRPVEAFLSMFAEFVSGACVYLVWKQLRGCVLAVLALLSCIACISLAVKFQATNNTIRTLTMGGASTCLLVLAITLENNRQWIASKWLRLCGDASFTLYLAHLSLFTVLYFSGLRTYLSTLSPLLLNVGFFAYLALCQALCCLYYLRIEAPIYRRACKLPFARISAQQAVLTSDR